MSTLSEAMRIAFNYPHISWREHLQLAAAIHSQESNAENGRIFEFVNTPHPLSSEEPRDVFNRRFKFIERKVSNLEDDYEVSKDFVIFPLFDDIDGCTPFLTESKSRLHWTKEGETEFVTHPLQITRREPKTWTMTTDGFTRTVSFEYTLDGMYELESGKVMAKGEAE